MAIACLWQAAAQPSADQVRAEVNSQYSSLLALYQTLHSQPELSFQEEKTCARLADELKHAGCEVSKHIGKFGVVGILRNGPGPVLLVRSDMDGLPVKEQTGLAYASTASGKDPSGKELPVMHACGHDVHMTCLVGVARVMAKLKDHWSGTLLLIGQPAEETGSGARAMLADGLFSKFPRPNFCLALHDNAELPAGSIGYTPGYAMANVDSVDILIRGVGGHGAYPHQTKDPVVLGAQVVLALQTIVSREIEPGEPAVVTVGSFHAGSKHNIISDEARLQLTVRSYTEEVRQQTLEAIKRITRGQALAAGIPEDRLPQVTVTSDSTPATYNDPALAARIVALFKSWFGDKNVYQKKPTMGGEDFSEFGRVEPKIPIFMFMVGGVDPGLFKEHEQSGRPLPSLHSPLWAPLPEATLKTGITAMSAAVLDLLGKPAQAR